jgi:hypothetical protein
VVEHDADMAGRTKVAAVWAIHPNRNITTARLAKNDKPNRMLNALWLDTCSMEASNCLPRIEVRGLLLIRTTRRIHDL